MTTIVENWEKYSPFFSESEFKCKFTGKCEMRVEFMDLLLTLRKKYGKAIIINSGYRDAKHPIEAAKATPGEHTKGMCADISVGYEDAFILMKMALEVGFTRVGVNQKGNGRFLHIGLGGEGLPAPRVWSY